MAAMYREEFGLEAELVPGKGGILEISYDGWVVWTNRDNRGFKPSNEEAGSAMREFLDRH
ncbi:MAG: hypothetical protein JNM28_10005 [Armatimonadetes bacterium]|nr:hypothetical protein [Armatimonadota bacterium]MBS1710604.1 hypothetical protein [Armatimonadota bacterium]MBX3108275.1 hypothetical protein [Fimbriimonadaceae bacterium]